MELQHKSKRVAIGIIILVVGMAVLLRSFGIATYYLNEYFFEWEMILFAVAFVNIVVTRKLLPGVFIAAVGAFFYFNINYYIPDNIPVWQVIFGAALIVGGISILTNHKKKGGKCPHYNCSTVADDSIDEVAIFGGGERVINSQNFCGGKILAIFGGSVFNCLKAKMSPGKNHIHVLAIFGGLKLVVPEDWDIQINVVSIFGGFSDKQRNKRPVAADNDNTLIIKGIVIFGGGEIKSY